MSLIDSDGRLFGKANLIDVIVVSMMVGLVALTYGAFRTFRPEPPTIMTISPNEIAEGERTTLQLTGENIRPFLEVRFGQFGSKGVYVENPTSALVTMLPLPAGTYDLTLLDKGRKVFSKSAALTVMGERWSSLSETDVQVLGSFVGMTAQEAASVAVGAVISASGDSRKTGEVLGVRPSTAETHKVRVSPLPGDNANIKSNVITVPVPGRFSVRAIVRLRCTIRQDECRFGETVLSQGKLLVLPIAGGSRSLRFQIDEVRPADGRVTFPPSSPAMATVKVRFVAGPEVIGIMNPGDIDIAGVGLVAETDRAVLLKIGPDRQTFPALVTTDGILRRSVQVEQPVVAFTGTVRVPVVYDPAGWKYKDRSVKVGAAFHFETLAGGMSGLIVEITVTPKK